MAVKDVERPDLAPTRGGVEARRKKNEKAAMSSSGSPLAYE